MKHENYILKLTYLFQVVYTQWPELVTFVHNVMYTPSLCLMCTNYHLIGNVFSISRKCVSTY